MTSSQGQATHQTVLELPLPPPSVHLEEEEQRMTPEEVTAFFSMAYFEGAAAPRATVGTTPHRMSHDLALHTLLPTARDS